jgi:hypothetical protein
VPKSTIARALEYIKRSRVAQGPYQGLFYYKIYGPGAYEKPREFAINAAAVTALAAAGVYERELWDDALAFIEKEYEAVAGWQRDHFYFWYGNYYACQAFFQAGGERFESYYQRLARDLLESQRADGSWVNRVGPGDAFATAVATLLLEVPAQYLPIFQR